MARIRQKDQDIPKLILRYGELRKQADKIASEMESIKSVLKEVEPPNGRYGNFKFQLTQKVVWKQRKDILSILETESMFAPHLKKLVKKVSVLDEANLEKLITEGALPKSAIKKLFLRTEQVALTVKEKTDEEAC